MVGFVLISLSLRLSGCPGLGLYVWIVRHATHRRRQLPHVAEACTFRGSDKLRASEWVQKPSQSGGGEKAGETPLFVVCVKNADGWSDAT